MSPSEYHAVHWHRDYIAPFDENISFTDELTSQFIPKAESDCIPKEFFECKYAIRIDFTGGYDSLNMFERKAYNLWRSNKYRGNENLEKTIKILSEHHIYLE